MNGTPNDEPLRIVRRGGLDRGLAVWVVIDRHGLQAWPKPGQLETQGACQRALDRLRAHRAGVQS